MAAQKSLAFAETAMSVHLKLSDEPNLLADGTQVWDIESRVISAGTTLPLKDMPPYLSEAVKEGRVPGLVAMTQAEAKKVEEFYGKQFSASAFASEQEDDPNFPAQEF